MQCVAVMLLQAVIVLCQQLAMHVHRPVRESAVRVLDLSFKRYSCLLPACIPTALCALAKLPIPHLLQDPSGKHQQAEMLAALEQAMMASAASSSQPAQLSAAGISRTMQHQEHTPHLQGHHVYSNLHVHMDAHLLTPTCIGCLFLVSFCIMYICQRWCTRTMVLNTRVHCISCANTLLPAS